MYQSVITDPSVRVAEIQPVFVVEKKLTDNLFYIEDATAGNFVVRLFPFAVFSATSKPHGNLSEFEEYAGIFKETKPFFYFQPLLILTNRCNLACRYCYAHEGSYGMKLEDMSASTLENTVQYLESVISTQYAPHALPKESTELGLICFGGEPLLAFDRVQQAHRQLCVLCARLTDVYDTTFIPTLTINTNGYEVSSAVKEFLVQNRRNIELVVSYDGWTHDEFRPSRSGKNTAQQVLANLFELHTLGVDVCVTTCVLPESTVVPEKLMDSLRPVYESGIPVNLSFIRGPLESVSERAIYPGFVQESYKAKNLDAFGVVVASEIQKGAPIYTRRYRRRLMEGGYRFRCGAGLYEFAVTPNGNVYPCHNFVSGKHILGNINDAAFAVPESGNLVQALQGRKVTNLFPCRDCVFQSTCMSSFDCPAHSLQDLGNISIVDDRFCGFARKVQYAILMSFLQECLNE